MTAIFITVLNMSITASIVALAVMFVRIPLKKAPKIFSYALWGVVMFRLIFPFSIESIFSFMPTPANMIPPDIVSTSPGLQFAGTPVSDMSIDNSVPVIIQASQSNLVVTAIELAGYVWLFGFIVLLVFAVIGYMRLKRRVCFATRVRDNIYETDSIKTPFVLGFFRPKIYFPTMIDPSKYDYILKHEQIHIRRRDYLIKPFAYMVFALHWFNPLMWIAYFLMSKDIEMSCDEAVLERTNEDIRGEYSTSLLCLSTKRVSLLNPTAFAYGEGNVKERIANVLSFKKSARWVTAASVLFVGIFLVGFTSDRVLTIDTPSSVGTLSNVINSSSIGAPSFNITNWDIDEDGIKVASPGDTHGIGMYILNRYFSAFRHEWESWGEDLFSLLLYPPIVDQFGNIHIQPWWGHTTEDIGDGQFFSPRFMFQIVDETGRLEFASYSPFTEYITTSIAPFAFSLDEAFSMYGDMWHDPALDINDDYMDMLVDFTLAFLGDVWLLSDTIMSLDIFTSWLNFSNGFVNFFADVQFASGKDAVLVFRVYETQFILEFLSLRF